MAKTDSALVDCLGNEPERLRDRGHCGLQRIFGEALKAWFEVLDRYTLADAVSVSRKLRDLLEIDGERPAAGTCIDLCWQALISAPVSAATESTASITALAGLSG